ncbi:MAG: FliH/SctL family protein [Ignavibacteria bacterium]|nr:FliH/SctL family protein [Ignavibacteria bacterium]
MQTIKLKLQKKNRSNTNTENKTVSFVIKEIVPELQQYQFEEFEKSGKNNHLNPFLQNILFNDFNKEGQQHKKKLQRPVFSIFFGIQNLNKPIEIDLSKVNQINLTAEEIQNQVQSAYEEGFNDGKQTTQMSLTEEINKLENYARRIDEIVEELSTEYSKALKELANLVVPVSIHIAKHILQVEVHLRPELVETQVRKALQILDNEKVLQIRLNSEDIEILKKIKSKLIDESRTLHGAEIVADPTIERGGCIVESSIGKIDATFQSQLEKIGKILSNISLLDFKQE